MLPIVMEIARLYLWRLLPGGKRARFYSVNAMRARHPSWFKEDLERLFGLLATGAIRPRVADRISFDEVPDAHRRLESGKLLGKLVLCPNLPLRRERESAERVESSSISPVGEVHLLRGAVAKEPLQQGSGQRE